MLREVRMAESDSDNGDLSHSSHCFVATILMALSKYFHTSMVLNLRFKTLSFITSIAASRELCPVLSCAPQSIKIGCLTAPRCSSKA
jgi:hypothetical protein